MLKLGPMHTPTRQCRICQCPSLEPVLDLGEQNLTGIFPRSSSDPVTEGPLVLIKCDRCGLVQLQDSYNPDEMYGETYGYRSGLNASMVAHLKQKAQELQSLVPLSTGDIVLDIGSNDGTSLGFYPAKGVTRIGMDPSAEKFRNYYQPGVTLIPDFFSAEKFLAASGGRKAKIVSSIAMFYDLEKPLQFMSDVAQILAEDGVWHFEQSYMPAMLQSGSYDTVCHEHLEYYSLTQICWMTNQMGLKIVDVERNEINGGSFAVTAAHRASPLPEATKLIKWILADENHMAIHTHAPYHAFARRVREHRDELKALLASLRADGKLVLGYGASTKGNVILQYCGLTREDLPYIAEVNENKFGCFTPGTNIPIISEKEAHAMKPDYFLVLPWHFKENLVAREAAFLRAGGKMIFPLPEIEIVGRPVERPVFAPAELALSAAH